MISPPLSRHFKQVHGYTAESACRSAYFYDLAVRQKCSYYVIEKKVKHMKGKTTCCVECKKNVVTIHRHLKSVHALSEDVYSKKLEECKLGVVPIEVKEDRKIAWPVTGCANDVKHIQKHLNNYVLQIKITKEDKILYLRKSQ